MSDDGEKKGRVIGASFLFINRMGANIKHGLATHQVRGHPVDAHIDLKGIQAWQTSGVEDFLSAPQPEGEDLWSFYVKLKDGREHRVDELQCNFKHIRDPSYSMGIETVILEASPTMLRIFMPTLLSASKDFNSGN